MVRQDQGHSEYRVGAVDDIPERSGVLVRAGGIEIGIFKVNGRLHAYENRCRHQGGPVCTGEIVGKYEQVILVDGTLGEERFDDDEVRIACPWHGWEYDLESGECTADRRFRLRRLQVRLDDGQAYVVV